MRKEADDSELREEYDFSAGVRGKYADRVREGVRLPRTERRDAADLDYRIWHSEAIGRIQAVEHLLALYLLASSVEDPASARRRAWEVAANPRESWESFDRAFGPLFPDRPLYERLRRLFVERAWWVHRATPRLSLPSEEDAGSVQELDELESFCERSRAVYSELLDLVRARLDEIGAPPERLDQLRKLVREADEEVLRESA